MFENTHLEIAADEAERLEEISPGVAEDLKTLEAQAGELARALAWMPGVRASDSVLDRSRRLRTRIEPLLRRFRAPLPTDAPVSDDVRWLHDNIRLVDMELHDLGETLKPLRTVSLATACYNLRSPAYFSRQSCDLLWRRILRN